MEVSMAKMEQKLDVTNTSLARLTNRVDRLEEKIHTMDINELEQTHQLKVLISEAVEQGIQKTSTAQEAAFSKLNMKLDDIRDQYGERIRVLEDKEEKKELELLRKRDEEKKADKKHVRNLIIACIISFLGAIILNNLVVILGEILKQFL